MKIINRKTIFFTISGILFLISILLWIAYGLNLGIDFTGGSLLEVEYSQQRPAVQEIRDQLADLNLDSLNIQPAGDKGFILRFKQIEETTHQNILDKLSSDQVDSVENSTVSEETAPATDEIISADSVLDISDSDGVNENTVTESRFEAIGPSIGKELRTKSIWAMAIVLIAIVIYIAWAFRKVAYPVISWKYGIVAIITLFHDIIITIGIYILLSKILGLEVNTPFVAALLTILGYSVNDTIVVFDRIRENLHKYDGAFEEIVDKSVIETIRRSIFTSLTTELVLLAILFWGGATIREFVLVLVVGIFFGTYSSIFIASPLLVVWQKLDWRLKKSE